MEENELEVSSEIREAQDRIKEARAELERINAEKATSEVPNAEQPKSAPVTEPDAMSALNKQVEELKRELSRRGGEYGSELDKLRKTLQVTSDNNAMLIKQMESFNKTKKEKKEDDSEEKEDWDVRRARYARKISAEQKEAYDDNSLDVMARMVDTGANDVFKRKAPKYIDSRIEELLERKLAERLNPHLQDIPQIKEKLEKVEASSATREFADVVDDLAPGFKRVNGTSTIPADENWLKFLDSPRDEFQTWREWCDDIKGPKVAAYAFQQYQKTLKPNATPVDQVAGQQSPPKSQAASSVSDGSAKVLTMADYQAFRAKWEKGEYSDDPQKAVQISEMFTNAAREGRLR